MFGAKNFKSLIYTFTYGYTKKLTIPHRIWLFKIYFLRPRNVIQFCNSGPSVKSCQICFYSTFGKWTPLSTKFLHSRSIIKLIYKYETLVPLTFSTHFSSYFLKLRAESNLDNKSWTEGVIFLNNYLNIIFISYY